MENYQDKKWLQEEINRFGTAQAVAKEYGWGKTTIARWVKKLEVSYPGRRPNMDIPYQNKEWLEEKLLECGNATKIARKYGYGSTTVTEWLHKYDLIPNLQARTFQGQEDAQVTYQNKYWLEEKMTECGTAKAIAEKYGYSETTIQRWTNKFGMSKPTTNPESAIYKNEGWLKNQFLNGKSIQEVADQCMVGRKAIQDQIIKFGIDTKALQSKTRHPYKNKQWLKEQVEKYGSGNKICKALGLPTTSVNRYIKKYGLLPNNIKPAIVLEINENFFEIIDSEEKAYWLGFLMADGYVHEKTTKTKTSYLIGLKLQVKDAAHIELFKKAIQTNATTKEIFGKRKGKIHEAREVCFFNEKMATDLYSHGVISKKTNKETIPKTIHKKYLHHFIRGYFDGDGSSIGGKFSVCCSYFLFEQLKKLLIEIGVDGGSIYRYHLKGTDVLTVNRKKEVPKIVKWIYQDATVYLERKRNAYEEKGFLQTSPSTE